MRTNRLEQKNIPVVLAPKQTNKREGITTATQTIDFSNRSNKPELSNYLHKRILQETGKLFPEILVLMAAFSLCLTTWRTVTLTLLLTLRVTKKNQMIQTL